MKEIERKWLVDVRDFVTPPTVIVIAQAYLVAEADKIVRVRHTKLFPGDEYSQLTYKQGAGLTRTEVNVPIAHSEMEQLMAVVPARERLWKSRYLIMHENHHVYVDVFLGKLVGLAVAEVEFETEKEALAFTSLPWFGKEVTDDMRYTNLQLARYGLPA